MWIKLYKNLFVIFVSSGLLLALATERHKSRSNELPLMAFKVEDSPHKSTEGEEYAFDFAISFSSKSNRNLWFFALLERIMEQITFS